MNNQSNSNSFPIQPGNPIKPETIKAWGDDIEAAWEKTGPCFVAPKYDGYQIQVHLLSDQVVLFSRRSLKDVTAEFPDVARAARLVINAENAILDTEVVPCDPDRKRLLPSTSMKKTLCHKAFVFEILYLNGEDWTTIPYEKHIQKINEVINSDPSGCFEPRTNIFAGDLPTLKAFYDQCLHDKLEGVIIKRPDARYTPGRRNSAKGKIKKWEPLDVVILGCRLTNDGRKIKQLHVGMKEKEGDKKLVKLGTIDRLDNNEVLHPELNAYLLAQLEQTKVGQQSLLDELVFQVEPNLVVEIKSLLKRQESKDKRIIFTLENPQFIRLREDKGPEDANTVEEFLPE